jgi:hypothetical protein
MFLVSDSLMIIIDLVTFVNGLVQFGDDLLFSVYAWLGAVR